jgi:hypothetical protein
VDKRANPYTPGAGLRPPKLAGRDGDLDELALLVDRLGAGRHERSLIYSGLRGVGKTVLLLEFDALACEAGWATTEVVEVGAQADVRPTLARMAGHVLRALARRHPVGEPAAQAIEVVERLGHAGGDDPEADVAGLLRAVGEVAAAAGTGALFLLDEMQSLDQPSLAAVCLAFQDLSKRELPVALVGAGLPDLPLRLFGAKPYADRLFAKRDLGRLAEPAARAALVGPAAVHGLRFEDAAVEAVLDESAGYPYFLQEYGRELWNHAEASPVTVSDVIGVRDVVHERLARDFFANRFELATDAEQRYLAAMASLGHAPYRTRDVAEAHGGREQRAVSLQRDGLIKKGLIWSPRRAYVDFTVPLFAEFLRERHPLGALEEVG